MLAVCTWLWGSKYDLSYVRKLAASVRRNLEQPHRFLLITERERDTAGLPEGIERHAIKDPELLAHRGCLARLRMFDADWQKNRGIDERLLCLDLDLVVTGELDVLVNRPDDLAAVRGVNATNPCPINCSMMMLRAGKNEYLWKEFSLETLATSPRHDFHDDQGWIWHKAPRIGGWAPSDGVYAFQKPGWPEKSSDLPRNARVVAFPGWRDPSKFSDLRFVQQHWRE